MKLSSPITPSALLLTIALCLPTVASAECYTLSLEVVGGRGQLPRVDPAPNCGPDAYQAGTLVRLQAQPALGFDVESWSGDVDAASKSTSGVILMTDHTSVGIHYSSQGDPYQDVLGGTPGGIARAPLKRADPKTVVGTDGRIRITPTTSDPWRRNAQLLMEFPGGNFICTAFFIGPRVLATAGHCLYNSSEGGWADKIEVIPARDGTGPGSEPFGRQAAIQQWSVSGWVNSGLPRYDFGAVILPDTRLSSAIGLGPDDYYVVEALTDEEIIVQLYDFVNIAGYPGDKAIGTQWFTGNNNEEVVGRNSDSISYLADTYGGMSGSAVYAIKRRPRRYAYAIHAYGAGSSFCTATCETCNCGVRIRQGVASFFYKRGVPLFGNGCETGTFDSWSRVVLPKSKID